MSLRSRAIVAAMLVIYGALLLRHTAFAVSGSDSSGYFNAARLLAAGQMKVRATPLDVLHLDDTWRDAFVPLGMSHVRQPGTFAPSYPLGYPLHLLLFAAIGGWSVAPYLVTPVAAVIALVALYLVARELGVPEGLAASGMLMLAFTPGWLFSAMQPMSDVPATMWCVLTMLFALRSGRGAVWAAAGGLAFAAAVWVRPTNILLAPAIGFAMRWDRRSMATAIVASLPPAFVLMLTNWDVFGSPLRTGYGAIAMTFGLCAPHHLWWLGVSLTPLIFPGALIALFLRRIPLSQRLTLASWFVPFLAFYSAYPMCDAWWYLRFLLPAFPPLLICFLLLIRNFRFRFALIAIVVVAGLAIARHYRLRGLHEAIPIEMQAVLKAPPNAVVAAMQMSGTYFYYAHRFALRYDLIDAARFEQLRMRAAAVGRPIYAVVFDWEEPALRRNMPGTWTQVDAVRDARLLRLDP